MVITDGKQTRTNTSTELSVASSGIKKKGVTVFALGIGKIVEQSELEEIASSSDYVFSVSSFEDVKTLADDLRKSLCKGVW